MNNSFFASTYNPDVLSCLANLSNDEVFTPPEIVNNMLDMLPKELWSDKNAKFLDPACKSGVFLREIAKRLLDGLKDEIPDLQQRIDNIFHNQLYGISITDLTSLLSRRSVYCSKYPNSIYSVTPFDDTSGNIRFKRIPHRWVKEKCAFCGASKSEYDRAEGLETHAYELIHTTKPEEIFNMKFDVIIGNPPYQLSTQQDSKQAKPIYNLFVEQAKKLKPRYLSMIIPSRWFAGGMGLNQFRENMLNDTQMKKIVDFSDSRDCFSGVDIAGGVCYFLWERNYNGLCEVASNISNNIYSSQRKLNEYGTFVRYQPAVEILRKIRQYDESSIADIISPVRPFGIPTKARGEGGNIKLIHSKGIGFISQSEVTVNKDWIDKWKVITSKASHDHAGQPDKDGKRRVLSRTEIIEPNTVCTESYIVLGCFKSNIEAQNCYKYVITKFVRFLVSLLSFSQDITRDKFSFVPMQNFSKPWTDEELYAKYGLTEDAIAFIDSMIRPMALNGGDGND